SPFARARRSSFGVPMKPTSSTTCCAIRARSRTWQRYALRGPKRFGGSCSIGCRRRSVTRAMRRATRSMPRRVRSWSVSAAWIEDARGVHSDMARRVDPWFLGILLVSLALNTYQLDWGLPNGNESWAADALGPVTVLGILHHSFHTWNSGWYYFKYPMGYALVLTLSFAPYLAYLFVTGGWKHPSTTYPFGFTHPDKALFVLFMLGRLVSVALGVGTVALTYLIGRRLFDRWTARIAAFFAATAYPIVYYAHTTNLDGSYLFWLI